MVTTKLIHLANRLDETQNTEIANDIDGIIQEATMQRRAMMSLLLRLPKILMLLDSLMTLASTVQTSLVEIVDRLQGIENSLEGENAVTAQKIRQAVGKVSNLIKLPDWKFVEMIPTLKKILEQSRKSE